MSYRDISRDEFVGTHRELLRYELNFFNSHFGLVGNATEATTKTLTW